MCGDHGECKTKVGKDYCKCDDGYGGPLCDKKGIIDIFRSSA